MPPTLTVTLEVDPTSDPIQGVARDERGLEHPFSGWLGLAKALELALRPAPEPSVPGGSRAAPRGSR